MIPELADTMPSATESPRDTYRKVYKALLNLKRENKILSFKAGLFLAMADFDNEVCNGGLAQYFTNSSGGHYHHVLDAFSHFGLSEQERILHKWLQLLPAEIDPANHNAVGSYLFADKKKYAASQMLDAAYYRERETYLSTLQSRFFE